MTVISAVAVFLIFIAYITIIPGQGTLEIPGEGVYSGELKGIRTFHGQGTWTSELGPVYEGEFKNGAFDGYGTMTFVDESKYEGQWKNGHMHGEGKMTFADGHVHEGVWDASEFLGDHHDCGHDH